MLSVRAVYVLATPSLLNSRILRRLDGKWLFHAEDRITVLVLFDKEVFVVIAHNVLLLCIYFAVGGACGLFKRMLKQEAVCAIGPTPLGFLFWRRSGRFFLSGSRSSWSFVVFLVGQSLSHGGGL